MPKNENLIPITDEMLSALYEQRLIVMMEVEKGKFSQVRLTKEQFKELSFALMKLFPNFPSEKNNKHMIVDLTLNDPVDGKPFEGMQSSY